MTQCVKKNWTGSLVQSNEPDCDFYVITPQENTKLNELLQNNNSFNSDFFDLFVLSPQDAGQIGMAIVGCWIVGAAWRMNLLRYK